MFLLQLKLSSKGLLAPHLKCVESVLILLLKNLILLFDL